MITKANRTQEQIISDESALMAEIEESNKDMHDNCDLNTCRACVGL